MKKLIQLICLVFLFPIALPYALAGDQFAELEGKEIAFDRKKGNCLACHAIDDGELPGKMGPPLINMQSMYPEKSKLRDQIWDATQRNPLTAMPPFGRHRMLTEEEIDKVVDYIYSL